MVLGNCPEKSEERELRPRRNRRLADENNVDANSQFRMGSRDFHGGVKGLTIGHDRRASDDSLLVATKDALIHSARVSEVVGIDDELLHDLPGSISWKIQNGTTPHANSRRRQAFLIRVQWRASTLGFRGYRKIRSDGQF